MLKKTTLELNHPCFGKIRFDAKFAKVLQLKPFRDLSHKSQLGTKSLSTHFVNAKHTRFLHSIGVYYLTSLLLKTCEEKFSNYMEITQQDKEILLLAALGHDIGHVAFSHSLEMRDMITHEQRTIALFNQYSKEINEIFEYDIVSQVIQILKNNIIIKKKGSTYEMDETLDILFIFSSLLVGTIDCDRMEYIITDRFMTTGEKLDFRSIFDYITIVLLNNSPTVGFESGAIPMIESLLTNRFEQYEQIYYDEDSTLIEMALKQYFSFSHWNQDIVVSSTEYGILSELEHIISSCEDTPTILSRLAEIILCGNRDDVLFKKFTSEADFHYFLDKVTSIIGVYINSVDWIHTCQKTNCIYNPSKNRVYIKGDDGVVKDICEVSLKITDLRINYYYLMIDLDEVYSIDSMVKKNLQSLFNDNPVEVEKKFVLEDELSSYPLLPMECSKIFSWISEIPGVSLGSITVVENHDQYFVPLTSIPDGIAMRLRNTNHKSTYYIKFPADDGTSITKREEQCFPNCSSLEDFLLLAKKSISLKYGIELDSLAVRNGICVTTKRSKAILTVFDSVIELAHDISFYEYEGNSKEDFMLECELKKGDDLSLWYLAKLIKKLGFIETNHSKEARAKRALNFDEK